jgi:8-oxo-dGTP diphosphatase
MDVANPKYKNQGIHVDVAVFTVDEGVVKTLVVQRAKHQFVGEWIIPGGAVYNDESLDSAAKRELEEKTGLKDIYLEQFHAFGDPKRDPRQRMVSIGYLALVDINKVKVISNTQKTLSAKWVEIDKVPKLAFDHNQIIKAAIAKLRKLIKESNICYSLLPREFTLPELQKTYEIILREKLDRRNFRRKLIGLGLIEKTGKQKSGGANRPANYYKFASKRFKEVNII